MWQILIRKWVLANQRNERCFSHVRKMIRQIRIKHEVFFHACKKMTRPIKVYRVSFQNSPLLQAFAVFSAIAF